MEVIKAIRECGADLALPTTIMQGAYRFTKESGADEQEASFNSSDHPRRSGMVKESLIPEIVIPPPPLSASRGSSAPTGQSLISDKAVIVESVSVADRTNSNYAAPKNFESSSEAASKQPPSSTMSQYSFKVNKIVSDTTPSALSSPSSTAANDKADGPTARDGNKDIWTNSMAEAGIIADGRKYFSMMTDNDVTLPNSGNGASKVVDIRQNTANLLNSPPRQSLDLDQTIGQTDEVAKTVNNNRIKNVYKKKDTSKSENNLTDTMQLFDANGNNEVISKEGKETSSSPSSAPSSPLDDSTFATDKSDGAKQKKANPYMKKKSGNFNAIRENEEGTTFGEW